MPLEEFLKFYFGSEHLKITTLEEGRLQVSLLSGQFVLLLSKNAFLFPDLPFLSELPFYFVEVTFCFLELPFCFSEGLFYFSKLSYCFPELPFSFPEVPTYLLCMSYSKNVFFQMIVPSPHPLLLFYRPIYDGLFMTLKTLQGVWLSMYFI